MIVDTLIILAIVEVSKTTLTYFSEGRVKVTFIVDTILVVMMTEIISKWFTKADLSQWMILGGILMVLGIIRIVAVQWPPRKQNSIPIFQGSTSQENGRANSVGRGKEPEFSLWRHKRLTPHNFGIVESHRI